MSAIVISLELLSVFILLIMLYGTLFEFKSRTKKQSKYMLMCVFDILGLLFDAISWSIDGRGYPDIFLYIINIFSVLMTGLIVLFYAQYLFEYLNEKIEVKKWLMIPIHVLNFVLLIATIVGSINGSVFYIDHTANNVVKFGDWFNFIIAISFIQMAYVLILVSLKYKVIGRHDALVIYFYFLMTLIAAFIEFFIPEFSVAYVAVALALVVIYITIQTEEVNSSRLRETAMKELYYLDVLTGLNNRSAYNEQIDFDYTGKKGGIIFCDINHLKYTNDEYGHAAGDKLILDFANVLLKVFDPKSIFRISGDEFVIISKNITEEEFLLKTKDLEKEFLKILKLLHLVHLMVN